MSFIAHAWAVRQRLPGTQKLVLLMLAERHNKETGQCNPSLELLAEDCGLSRRSVIDQVAKLQAAGYLTIHHRARGSLKLPSQYALHLSFGEAEKVPVEANEVLLQPELVVKDVHQGSEPAALPQCTTFTRVVNDVHEGSERRAHKPGIEPGNEPVIEPVKKKKAAVVTATSSDCVVKPDDVTEQTWSDWLQLRKTKRAGVTKTVVDGARRESVKAGIPLEDFLQVWCVRGSQGLLAEWLKPAELQAKRLDELGGGVSCPVEELLDAYAELLPMLTQPRRSLFADGEGASDLRARWGWVMTANAESGVRAGQRMATTADEGVAWFKRFFGHVANSTFLLGQASDSNFEADLRWLMKRDNFEKVLEGRYHREVVNAG